jgi:hypothetical protein
MKSGVGNAIRTAACALLAAGTLASTGCAGLASRRPNSAERAILATYVVASKEALGSGVLIAARTSRKTYVPVLITSTHLIGDSERDPIEVYLRFVTSDGSAYVTTERLSRAREGETYAVHPLLDVAAFKLNWPKGVPTSAALPFIEDNEIGSSQELRAGDEVGFAGFPEGVGGASGSFAVLRAGRIASFEQSFFGLPFFIINAGVYPGDSGAPVFLASHRNHPKLVGMVVRYFSDSEQHPMPLALAVDADAIRETIAMLIGSEKSRLRK